MFWSVKKTLCFLVISLLFFQTKSQVISKSKANEGTLKHLVSLKVFWKSLDEEKREQIALFRLQGSLIKPNWILTAAHNVADHNETVNSITTEYFFYKVEVLAGTKDWKNFSNETTQQRTVYKKGRIVHKNYKPIGRYYDVALIYTKKSFEITDTVEPAKLLEPDMKFDSDVKCVIQGWGYNELVRNEDNQLRYSLVKPNRARQGSVNILNGESCARAHLRNDGTSVFNYKLHFCYGCNNGKCEQTAPGDSGTPVVCALKKGDNPLTDGVVFAVHSYGCKDLSKKCFPGGPSAGTDVRKIKDWIDSKTTKRGIKRTGVSKFLDSMYPYYIAGAVVIGSAITYFY